MGLSDDLDYDPKTGIFRWKKSGKRRRVGMIAGTISVYGYRNLVVDRARYRAARVAWFLSYGRWPDEVDHINRNKLDDRLCNLREVTRSENAINTPARVSHGEKNIYWNARDSKWRVIIMRNYKSKQIGTFESFEEAINARDRYLDRIDGRTEDGLQ
jgi:HNH endonuclease/AP2 domain